MSLRKRPVLVEMIIILACATVIGIAWNHELLLNAWSGKAVTAPQAQTQPAQGGIPLPVGLMQVKDFFDRKEAVLVDARDSATFAKGHISRAKSLPLGELNSRLARFKSDVPLTSMLIVYCNGYDCHDSMDLGKKLLQAGYRDVFVFEGGFPEWRDAGYPLSEGAQ